MGHPHQMEVCMEIGITLDNRLVKNIVIGKTELTTAVLLMLVTATTIGVTVGGAAVMASANTMMLTAEAGLGTVEEAMAIGLGTVVQTATTDLIAKLSPVIVFVTGGISALLTNR